MSDLRLIGRSEDGTELELQTQDGVSFTLRISDHLRSLVNQPRLVAVENIDERSTVTVKDVQSRLRGGETIDSIARSTDWSLDKIEKFSGPILQERAYIIGLALEAQLRKEKHSPTLVTAVISQLAPRGVDMSLVEWNTWREVDGSWNILLSYPIKEDSTSEANWSFDVNNRSLSALDDGAAWISGEDQGARQTSPSHGIVANTPAPRLVSVKESEVVETIRISSLDAIIDSGPSIEELVPEDAKRDGVTRRLKIPSWDDIMFGGPKEIFGGPKEIFGGPKEPSEEE